MNIVSSNSFQIGIDSLGVWYLAVLDVPKKALNMNIVYRSQEMIHSVSLAFLNIVAAYNL